MSGVVEAMMGLEVEYLRVVLDSCERIVLPGRELMIRIV
jgi:hypothetical protein